MLFPTSATLATFPTFAAAEAAPSRAYPAASAVPSPTSSAACSMSLGEASTILPRSCFWYRFNYKFRRSPSRSLIS